MVSVARIIKSTDQECSFQAIQIIRKPIVSELNYQSGATAGESVRVLLIEDDPGYSKTIQALISGNRESIEVEVADHLAEGLDRLTKGGIDLVLLDLSLPDSDGMLTLIRTRKHVPHLPIVILTGCDDEEIALEAAQAGAQDYLVKDQIDLNLLRRTLRYAIERQRAELVLREQAELLDAARDAILVQDLEGRILYWNRAAERLYGWTREEILGTKLRDWVDDATLAKWGDKFNEIRRTVLNQGEWMGELENYTKDGRMLIVECRCALMRDADDRPKSVLVINTDITEKKQIESQFLRMQRMESVGALASGIAHDLNNWLSPILTSIHTLQQRFTDPNSQKWLAIIRNSAERSRDLVDQILTFARGKGGERMALNTAYLVSDVAKILGETLPKNVALKVELPGDLWSVLGDATQLHQVLMNLCINARDAMPGGGALKIEAANTVLSEDDVWMINDVRPGKYIQVSVQDTGVGMNQELIDHAFEPFFTTKENGLGTGLGLSITLGIVRGHGGFISIASAVGKGSHFKVYLPASDVAAGVVQPQAETPAPMGNGELVLVVDDEEDIREITVATLESCGYRALGATGRQEALALFAERRSEIELMIADLALPDLDDHFFGNSLLGSIKIIGTSGLRSRAQIELAKKAGIETMLWKPYTAEQLLVAIEENLTRP
ncbi:MAG: response regulator [Blastocatellia bacterium]